MPPPLSDFDHGFFTGLVTGEGHLGGDGRQPQLTIRMHVRHEKLFRWLSERFPGGRLYGPYHHGGRHYYQWMARGAYLRETIVPLLLARIDALDEHVRSRLIGMCGDYGIAMPEAAPAAAPRLGDRAEDPLGHSK